MKKFIFIIFIILASISFTSAKANFDIKSCKERKDNNNKNEDFMKKLLSGVLAIFTATLIPSLAFAGDLRPNDVVGVTFWIISIAMVAATVFFVVERSRVSGKWQTSLSVISLVTLIAAVHYLSMRYAFSSTLAIVYASSS